MKLEIIGSRYSETMNFERINQWCGLNIILKDKCLDSLVNYFSNTKKLSLEEDIKIRIDDVEVGRKYYQLICINDREQLISVIKNMKTGLVIRLIQDQLTSFDNEYKLEELDSILISIFSDINAGLVSDLGNISLDYEREALWSMVQKSELKTENGDSLETLSTMELLDIFFNSLERICQTAPEKYLIVFKNIDHFVLRENYLKVVSRSYDNAYKYDTTYIFTTSLPRYVLPEDAVIEGITVFNNVVYSLPDNIHLKEFINDYYPCQKEFDIEEISNMICDIIHYINVSDLPVENLQSLVLQRMINKSNLENTNVFKNGNKIEIQYISGEDML